MTARWRWWHRDGLLGSLRPALRRQKYLPLTDMDTWHYACSCLNVASFCLSPALRYLSPLIPRSLSCSLSFNQLKHTDFLSAAEARGSAFGGQPLDTSIWDGWGWGGDWSLNTTHRQPQTFSINQVTVQGITHSLVSGSGRYNNLLQLTQPCSYLPFKTVETVLMHVWNIWEHQQIACDT